jgi:hypothetical protein
VLAEHGCASAAIAQAIGDRLLDGQQAEGSWSLPSLGTWVRPKLLTLIKNALTVQMLVPGITVGELSVSYVRDCWPLDILKPAEEFPQGFFPEGGNPVGSVS